ncbi:MAG: hypothetical protein ACOH2M_31900 [Cypionkella sp.]
MKVTVAPTIRFDIFIAGDADQAKQVCREHCFAVGLCVTVEPVSYIYTGGEEAGIRVGLINYPRFPTTFQALKNRADALGLLLMERLLQHSFCVIGPGETTWYSRRPEDSDPTPPGETP